MEKRKYRAKELAEYLGIGLSTVWKWAKEGKIKSHNISRGVTIFDINEVLLDLGMEIN
jgi:excisionase family DNA binding protein